MIHIDIESFSRHRPRLGAGGGDGDAVAPAPGYDSMSWRRASAPQCSRPSSSVRWRGDAAQST